MFLSDTFVLKTGTHLLTLEFIAGKLTLIVNDCDDDREVIELDDCMAERLSDALKVALIHMNEVD